MAKFKVLGHVTLGAGLLITVEAEDEDDARHKATMWVYAHAEQLRERSGVIGVRHYSQTKMSKYARVTKE